MSSRRQKSIPSGGRYRQVSLKQDMDLLPNTTVVAPQLLEWKWSLQNQQLTSLVTNPKSLRYFCICFTWCFPGIQKLTSLQITLKIIITLRINWPNIFLVRAAIGMFCIISLHMWRTFMYFPLIYYPAFLSYLHSCFLFRRNTVNHNVL